MVTDNTLGIFLMKLEEDKYDLYMALLLKTKGEFLLLNKTVSLFPEMDIVYEKNLFKIKETFIKNLGANIFKEMNRKDAVKILSKST